MLPFGRHVTDNHIDFNNRLTSHIYAEAIVVPVITLEANPDNFPVVLLKFPRLSRWFAFDWHRLETRPSCPVEHQRSHPNVSTVPLRVVCDTVDFRP